MFAKEFRLPLGKKYQFSDISSTQHLRLSSLENNLTHNRYAALVSKKISKRAVVRNAIRRGLIQMLQEQHSRLLSPYDYFVLVTKYGEIADLKKELHDLLTHHTV